MEYHWQELYKNKTDSSKSWKSIDKLTNENTQNNSTTNEKLTNEQITKLSMIF